MSRIFGMAFAAVYPLYVQKVERKGRSAADVDAAILWLTGFNERQLRDHLEGGSTFAEFFAAAPMSPEADLITGVICGVRVEQIEDPLMKKIRQLDKIVDEIARGKPLEKVLRPPLPAAASS